MSNVVPLGLFEIHEPLGMSGMGEIWRGLHRQQGLPIAVKLIRRDSVLADGAAAGHWRYTKQHWLTSVNGEERTIEVAGSISTRS